MIIEIKKRKVTINDPFGLEAYVVDGRVESITLLYHQPSKEMLEEYVQFCQEILEAIKQTK